MQKQLLITFDYELFLGNRSGFVDDCMINPTHQITRLLDKYQAKAVFFIDTTYLLRLKEAAEQHSACKADFQKVAAQLQQLVAGGHYVFPHLHPHWLDAVYHPDTNQWQLNDTSRYLFGKLTPSEQALVFDGSVELMYSILAPSAPSYRVNGYRAGGWSIQPFDHFYPFFVKHDFRYEFSVLGGFYQFTDAQYFDFSNAPEKNIYRFHRDVCKEEPDGPFIQYNISSIPVSRGTVWMNKIWIKLLTKLTGDHTFHKGEGQPSRIMGGIQPASVKGKDLAHPGWERVAIELMTRVKLDQYLAFPDQHTYMHFISHPKMITRHNLSMFDQFMHKTYKKYSVETDFMRMQPE